MAILNTTADLKKYVGLAQTFNFADFEPYINRAVIKYTRKYVGDLHILLENPATGEGADIKNEAREYLRDAIANFGMYEYAPLGSVFFDSSGISNVSNEQRKPVEWWQMNDLRRSMLGTGHEAMDLLLAFLEKNKTVFTDWAESVYYTESKELLVNNTDLFDKYYNIFQSRRVYLSLRPSIRQIEDQYVSTFLCKELIAHLKTTDVTGVKKEVKDYLQKAIVAFTVSKIVDEGLFIIDPEGIKLKYDALPNDKVQAPDYGKPADFLTITAKNQNSNGVQYLKMVKDIILANPLEFNQCVSPIIQESSSGGYQSYNTQSVVGL